MDYTKGYIAGLEVAFAAVNRVFYCPEDIDDVRKLLHDALAEAEERANMTLEEMLAEFQQPSEHGVL